MCVFFYIRSSIVEVKLSHGATMNVVLASKSNNKHRAVIILPGGGYSSLAKGREGYMWIPFFHKQGYTVAVLEYRMPHQNYKVPYNDAADAIRFMREYAKRWNYAGDSIGIMGFSAGGHLASTMIVSKKDSIRPNFAILFYPVISMRKDLTHMDSHDNLLGKDASEELEMQLSNELHVSDNTPSTFIALSSDDELVDPQNSILFYKVMRAKGCEVSLHEYPSGGHGWSNNRSFKYHERMIRDLKGWLDER